MAVADAGGFSTLVASIVIAAICHGMGRFGMSAAAQCIGTAFVLVTAVTAAAVARRGRASAR